MAQDYDIVDRLEKQIEGSNLALAAVAVVVRVRVAREVANENQSHPRGTQ